MLDRESEDEGGGNQELLDASEEPITDSESFAW